MRPLYPRNTFHHEHKEGVPIFVCRSCCSQINEDVTYAAYVLNGRAQAGFVCPDCYETMQYEGRIVGSVASDVTEGMMLRQLFTLRSLQDEHRSTRWQYDAIIRLQQHIAKAPLRHTLDIVKRMVRAYRELALLHGGWYTFEGWLLLTCSRHLHTMVQAESRRGSMYQREKLKHVLKQHDAVVEAARRNHRDDVIRHIVALLASTYSTRLQTDPIDTSLDACGGASPAISFLTLLTIGSSSQLGPYRTWRAIESGNAWVVFLAAHVDMLAISAVQRIAEMLIRAVLRDEPHRYEVVLRAMHWDFLLQHTVQASTLL